MRTVQGKKDPEDIGTEHHSIENEMLTYCKERFNMYLTTNEARGTESATTGALEIQEANEYLKCKECDKEWPLPRFNGKMKCTFADDGCTQTHEKSLDSNIKRNHQQESLN